MNDMVKGRRGSRAQPGPPSPLTLFNTLITVPRDYLAGLVPPHPAGRCAAGTVARLKMNSARIKLPDGQSKTPLLRSARILEIIALKA